MRRQAGADGRLAGVHLHVRLRRRQSAERGHRKEGRLMRGTGGPGIDDIMRHASAVCKSSGRSLSGTWHE
jgi:hypothetical protein